MLPHLMQRISPAFALPLCSFKVERNKESTARVAIWRQLGVSRYTVYLDRGISIDFFLRSRSIVLIRTEATQWRVASVAATRERWPVCIWTRNTWRRLDRISVRLYRRWRTAERIGAWTSTLEKWNSYIIRKIQKRKNRWCRDFFWTQVNGGVLLSAKMRFAEIQKDSKMHSGQTGGASRCRPSLAND